MCGVGSKWRRDWRLQAAFLIFVLLVASISVSAQSNLKQETTEKVSTPENGSSYIHVWPKIKFGWKIVVGSILASFGAACGSVSGVGGGGIFVSMLTLIIGFDSKSSTAISKCMITAHAAFTVLYNVKQRHPTLELPLIDYDLALVFQPMLVLGISIGVTLNVILTEWMITTLLMIFAIALSTRAFFKGVETWKRETLTIKEARPIALSNTPAITKEPERPKVSIRKNIHRKELGLLVVVWVIILALQIAKNYTATCSALYWIINLLQIPVAGIVTGYEAVGLYKGWRKVTSTGEVGKKWKVHQLVFCCFSGVMAGIIGGLLGLGGGFIIGPVMLELGVPPQVSSATSIFAMFFSSSISAVEYYLLKRFPIDYALFFCGVVVIGAFVGQNVMSKLINKLGRASLVIFILAFTIFVSSSALGGVGIGGMIKRIQHGEYMGFEDLCSYKP